jgi:hypothetical protein
VSNKASNAGVLRPALKNLKITLKDNPSFPLRSSYISSPSIELGSTVIAYVFLPGKREKRGKERKEKKLRRRSDERHKERRVYAFRFSFSFH